MINTTDTIRYMPAKLAAFKRYIQTYMCTYWVCNQNHNLIFYKKVNEDLLRPYVIVTYCTDLQRCVIYANRTNDDLSKSDCILRKCNIVNDMKTFLEEIRKCYIIEWQYKKHIKTLKKLRISDEYCRN